MVCMPNARIFKALEVCSHNWAILEQQVETPQDERAFVLALLTAECGKLPLFPCQNHALLLLAVKGVELVEFF